MALEAPPLHNKLTLRSEGLEFWRSPSLLRSAGLALCSLTSDSPGRAGLLKKKKKHTAASGMLRQTTKTLVDLWEFNPSLALNNNQRRSEHFLEARKLKQQVCVVNEPCFTVEAHVFEQLLPTTVLPLLQTRVSFLPFTCVLLQGFKPLET